MVVDERHVVWLRGDDVQVLMKVMRVGVDEGHRPWHESIAAGDKENSAVQTKQKSDTVT